MSPRHPRQSERDDETKHHTSIAARRRANRCAAVELHFGQGAGQADRHQPQRDDQAGGAGTAPARRRAADQSEPASVPATDAEEAVMRAIVLAAAFVMAAPAAAQTPAVNAARAAGAVGERFDGYIGVAAPVTAVVRSQVATINIRRRSLYSNLAAAKGVSPQDVGITAA